MANSSYSHYRGRSAGRIIHFLHHHFNYAIASTTTIGEEKIMYGNKLIATFKWSEMFGMCDVPEFDFVAVENDPYLDGAVKYSSKDNEVNKNLAIDASMALYPPDEESIREDFVRILNKKAYQRLRFFASIIENEYRFFTDGKDLFAYIGKDMEPLKSPMYKLDNDLNEWLLWWKP